MHAKFDEFPSPILKMLRKNQTITDLRRGTERLTGDVKSVNTPKTPFCGGDGVVMKNAFITKKQFRYFLAQTLIEILFYLEFIYLFIEIIFINGLIFHL